MRTRTPASTAASLTAAALLCLGGLSACSGDDLGDRLTEKAIENAGGEDVDVDFDSDTGEVKIETDEGTFSSGSDLPDDFPEDLPLLEDAEIISAIAADDQTGTGDSGFVVAMQTDLSDTDALVEATALLEGAGFVLDEESTGGGVGVFGAAVLNRDPYQVLVSALGAEGSGTTLQYYVGPIPE
ncbi:MAG: hypothetical protein WB767_07740 [Nocardioides sp.]